MASGPQFPIIPCTNFDAAQASNHWAYGGGQTIYLDRSAFMNQGPGQVYQIQDVPAVQSAFGSLSSGQTIFNNSNSDDFEISHQFYWDGLAGVLSDESYVFGSSSAVFKGSITGVTSNIIFIDGQLRPYDDQFDFSANTWNPFLEAARAIGGWFAGPGTPFTIKFGGGDGRTIYGLLEEVVTHGPRGQSAVTYKFTPLPGPSVRCFPANTPIQISLTSTAHISTLKVGDVVLAFDPKGCNAMFSGDTAAPNITSLSPASAPLVPARVTRLFSNVTDEWLVITAAEGECERLGIEAFELTVTPGHEMLDAYGRFRNAIDIVTSDAQFVREDGRVVKVQHERVIYSAATAHLYEEAEIVVAHTEGGLALLPQVKRDWKTYNFEVETYHTWVVSVRGAWRRECSQSYCLDNPSHLAQNIVQRQAACSQHQNGQCHGGPGQVDWPA